MDKNQYPASNIVIVYQYKMSGLFMRINSLETLFSLIVSPAITSGPIIGPFGKPKV